jgi:hypothetical protein
MTSPKENLWKKIIGFLRINEAIQSLSIQMSRRKAFRAALVRAYAICGSYYYPDWAAYFLDKEFQANGAGRLQACYLEKGACLTPAELGKFWADQVLMPWLSDKTKQRYFTELADVAAGFLRRLEAELCAERNLRAVLSDAGCSDTGTGSWKGCVGGASDGFRQSTAGAHHVFIAR